MKRLTDDIIHFFHKENFVIVSTIDNNGRPHSSCKGIVEIDENNKIYLLDLYKKRTYNNLKRNSGIAITAVDEHKFKGYCLKGKAKVEEMGSFKEHTLKAWEKRIITRISQRVIKNMQGEKGHTKHPEALLPEPEYLIVMEVEEIVDLTPHKLK